MYSASLRHGTTIETRGRSGEASLTLAVTGKPHTSSQLYCTMQVIMQNTVQSAVLLSRSCVVHGFDNSLHPPFAPSRCGSSGTGVALTPHGHTLLRAKPPKDGDAEL